MRTTGDVGPVNASQVAGAADAFRCVLTAAILCRLWALGPFSRSSFRIGRARGRPQRATGPQGGLNVGFNL
jgi:hypothetical protein